MLPAIVDSTGDRRERDRAARAPRRSRACSAISRRRSSARVACTRATPRSRSAPAACSTSTLGEDAPRVHEARGPHGTFPIVAWRARRRAPRGASRRSCSRPAPTCSGFATTWASSTRPRSRTSSRRTMRDSGRRRVRPGAARSRHAAMGLRRARRAVRPHPRHRRARRSCARCSRASPTGAPDLVDAAEADAGVTIPTLRVDGGMTDNPTFVQALADAVTTAGRDLTRAGSDRARRRAHGRPRRRSSRVRRRPRAHVDAAGARRAHEEHSIATSGATPCSAPRHWIPALSGIDF